MIVQLFSAVSFAVGTVLLGWAMGHVGWISLALYSLGGLAGLAMVCPAMMILGGHSAARDEAGQNMGEATA